MSLFGYVNAGYDIGMYTNWARNNVDKFVNHYYFHNQLHFNIN